ncbi:MAG: C_GCAxxG_C_C family protein [Sedimentisphaerales bacterium]|nr:C_GCAxxG_C_C family protein [Sedimentisphaerales bacterium]
MSNADKAAGIFKEGFSCSMAMLSTYCEQFGLDKNLAYKVSSGFGGGMHLDQTCGAVTGAFMVIGLKFGRTRADDIEAKMKVAKMTNEFAKKFKARHGSIGCTALIGCNISTPQGFEEARKKNLFEQVCPKYVVSAAEILDEML